MIGFESFWGSAASMELNVRAVSAAREASASANEWAAHAVNLERRIGGVEHENFKVESRNAQLVRQAEELQREIAVLRREVSSLSLDNERLEIKLSMTRKELDQSHVKIEGLRDDKRKLIGYVRELQAEREPVDA